MSVPMCNLYYAELAKKFVWFFCALLQKNVDELLWPTQYIQIELSHYCVINFPISLKIS